MHRLRDQGIGDAHESPPLDPTLRHVRLSAASAARDQRLARRLARTRPCSSGERTAFAICAGRACTTEHRYVLTVTWTGNTGEGTSTYRGYRRTHTVAAEGPPELLGSADRTFHGARRWNPEQLLLASLAQCHMLSYLHVCVDAGVVVTHYLDRATGSMRSEADGSGRFTGVVLHPEVTVADYTMVEAATKAHRRANELCFIANSVNFQVRHEPVVRTAD